MIAKAASEREGKKTNQIQGQRSLRRGNEGWGRGGGGEHSSVDDILAAGADGQHPQNWNISGDSRLATFLTPFPSRSLAFNYQKVVCGNQTVSLGEFMRASRPCPQRSERLLKDEGHSCPCAKERCIFKRPVTCCWLVLLSGYAETNKLNMNKLRMYCSRKLLGKQPPPH